MNRRWDFEQWRELFLNKMIWFITIISWVVFSLSLSTILIDGFGAVFYADVVGLLLLTFIAGFKRAGLGTRALITSLVIYFVGINLLIERGFHGTGALFIFIVPLVAALFYGNKVGKVFLLVNLITFLVFYLTSFLPVGFQPEFNGMTSQRILIVYLNIIGANAIVALPVGRLMDNLRSSLRETESVKRKLEQRNIQLAEVNEELDQFLYRSAHDLRSPLASLLGLINLARIDSSNNQLEDYFSMMNKSVGHMDRRLSEILDYIKNMNFDVEFNNVSLNLVYSQILDSLQYDAQRINFINEIGVNDNLCTDRSRLTIILENLISNAIKYADFNKDQPYVKIILTEESGKQAIYIEDNGQGIESEYHSRIFDRFYRANEKSSGSGLGLYIAFQAAEKMGSTLNLTSSSVKGTTFCLLLPDMGTVSKSQKKSEFVQA
ncbi:MAG: HAMP domain-containing sensor histidine kinase [Bacteroidota bacterium]